MGGGLGHETVLWPPYRSRHLLPLLIRGWNTGARGDFHWLPLFFPSFLFYFPSFLFLLRSFPFKVTLSEIAYKKQKGNLKTRFTNKSECQFSNKFQGLPRGWYRGGSYEGWNENSRTERLDPPPDSNSSLKRIFHKKTHVGKLSEALLLPCHRCFSQSSQQGGTVTNSWFSNEETEVSKDW